MQTTDGGECIVRVNCREGGEREYADFSSCFVGGRQFLADDRIGDFSVTFTQADGTEGEGLTDPVLQVAALENSREIPVSALALEKDDADRCEGSLAPIGCHNGPFVCEFVNAGNTLIFADRTKRWHCGVPVLGANLPDGVGWDDIFNQ